MSREQGGRGRGGGRGREGEGEAEGRAPRQPRVCLGHCADEEEEDEEHDLIGRMERKTYRSEKRKKRRRITASVYSHVNDHMTVRYNSRDVYNRFT
jgi:hypothetical protein